LAGLFPCAAICEILNDDGSMARVPELFSFKKRFSLKMISIAALIEYRIKRDKLVTMVREMPFETEFGPFTLKIFRSKLDHMEHYALIAGQLDASPTLVRVHAENLFTDLFRKSGKQSCDPLHAAMAKISQEGSGAVVFISRPDRGFSQLDEVKEATMSTGLRDYGIGAQILVALGLEKIRLLSNTSRNVVGLDGFGLEIVEQVDL
jgi:3,4-dihydroxy 2-butanone 4-phosphate synthase / GTP cyclohydrolase II